MSAVDFLGYGDMPIARLAWIMSQTISSGHHESHAAQLLREYLIRQHNGVSRQRRKGF